ncbi:MAG: hypothetical protein CMJ25_12180 [Phycisphaerae bacterium]|nr:hypothetical protein [Phycisphaerae bacterium]
MYTLQYRIRKDNGRLTQWFNESRHELREDAKKSLGEHVGRFLSFNCRVVRDDGQVVGEYKYKRG